MAAHARVTSGHENELTAAFAASRELFVWAAAFSACVNLLYLSPSIFMLQVYDRVLQTGGLVTLAYCGVVLAFALATLAVLDSLRGRLLNRVSLRLDRLLSRRIIEASSAGPSASATASRQALRAFDSLRQSFSGPAATAALDAPWTPVYLIACFLLHPLIGAAVILGGAMLIAVAFRSDHVLRARAAKTAELAPEMYAAAEMEAQVAGVMKSLGMRSALIDRQLARREIINDRQASAAFASSFYASFSRFLRLALQSFVLGLGAYLAIERQISPGALIAGTILASRALAPLEQIVGAWRQLSEARESYRSIGRILAALPPEPARTELPAPKGALDFEKVIALAARRPVLQQISFSLAPGEILCIVGPSGAGKSTLARLAAGAAAPDGGVVRIDGANFADWNSETLGKHVGYLPQEIALVSGTVADNIRRLEAKGANDDAVVAAADAAGAHEMILRLPNGYDTELGLGGAGLSAGQSQRVALARALYRDPALLILDEPNAHLDQEGEAALATALRNAKARGAAILLVAHRQGIVSLADRVMVLKDGRIEMLGPRDQVGAQLAAAAKGGAPVVPVRKHL